MAGDMAGVVDLSRVSTPMRRPVCAIDELTCLSSEPSGPRVNNASLRFGAPSPARSGLLCNSSYNGDTIATAGPMLGEVVEHNSSTWLYRCVGARRR